MEMSLVPNPTALEPARSDLGAGKGHDLEHTGHQKTPRGPGPKQEDWLCLESPPLLISLSPPEGFFSPPYPNAHSGPSLLALGWQKTKVQAPAERSRGARNTLFPNANPKRGQLRVQCAELSCSSEIYRVEMGVAPDSTALEPAQLDSRAMTCSALATRRRPKIPNHPKKIELLQDKLEDSLGLF
ncbi:hypothetical protein P7K49_014730 [Saguinus oedipus]|uniref:Uncharacterized protein n=1 Tax=Saguinus oedipus TaxID=9490 RepID=A0ABQ9V7U2_SAGOE|nr:hypothetical protein P7K49_014730 [Saguinus oedipus]